MRNTYLNFKKAVLFVGVALLFGSPIQAQTLSWNGYTQGSVSPYVFSVGTAPNNMQAVVTTNSVTRHDNTPRYATTSGDYCYINGSLALHAGTFGSATSANNPHFTVTMTFNPGYTGTCNYAQFTIMDINSEESSKTFCDVLEISAMDGNGNPIAATTNALGSPAAGGITTTLASNLNRSVSGNILKITGHNSSQETQGSFNAGASCGITTVRVKPPDNVWLKSITIKYRPAHGTTTGNTYWNFNTLRPAFQWISISNITLTPITCPTPLPVELSSFTGESEGRSNLLKWGTATEKNNSHFELERSTNGVEWEKISTINGAGTTLQPQFYRSYDNEFEHTVNYYRLKQVDYDGTEKLSDIVAIDNSIRTKILDKIVNTMGQEVDESYKGMKIYIYTDGTIIKKMD
jgi:hypothetical protein